MKLFGTLNIFLLPGFNIFSDRFGSPLDRLSRHFQASQEFHLVPPLSKGRLAAYRRKHAPYTG